MTLNTSEKTKKQIRKKIAEICTIFTFIICTVNICTDYFVHQDLTWSRYSLTSILFAWLVFTLFLILPGKKILVALIAAPISVFYLYLLSVFSYNAEWFMSIGLPILGLSEFCIFLTVFLCMTLNKKGLNIIAIILLGLTVVIIGIEGIIIHAHNVQALRWSLITAFATIPASFLCLYFHYRIVNQASLRKLFRL